MIETTGILKPFDTVDREAAFFRVSPSGSNIKIYHSSYFPHNDEDRLHFGDDITAIQKARLLRESGSSKGYLGLHADYKSMFGRKVTIRPKHNKDGSVNKHQCFVMGNRNKERIAFTAYNSWFQTFTPMPPITRPMGIDITRVSWDQLFEI